MAEYYFTLSALENRYLGKRGKLETPYISFLNSHSDMTCILSIKT